MTLLFPVVEGHGEIRAFPVLIRRILHEKLARFECFINPPYRLPRSKILDFGDELENVLRYGARRIQDHGAGGIVILADADDDCPVEVQSAFQKFLEEKEFNVGVSCIIASREYEAWFISCAEHLAGHASVINNVASHPNPEAVRDAKGIFERQILVANRKYSETVDQEKFSALINLDCVYDVCRSFRKLQKEVGRLSG